MLLKEALDSRIFLMALYLVSSTFLKASNNSSFPKLKALDLGEIFLAAMLVFKSSINDLLIFCLLLKNFSFSWENCFSPHAILIIKLIITLAEFSP